MKVDKLENGTETKKKKLRKLQIPSFNVNLLIMQIQLPVETIYLLWYTLRSIMVATINFYPPQAFVPSL